MIERFLALLQRRGTVLMAAGLLVGIALPELAHLMRPGLPALVFVLTVAAFLGTDPAVLVGHARRPERLLLVPAWILLASPVLAELAANFLGLPQALGNALVLWAASPPLSSSPAIAMLLGLDGALALLAVIGSTFLMPLVLPPLALGLIGVAIGVGIVPLMARLALFILGAGLVAALLRRSIGADRLQRRESVIGGCNVVLLHLFAIAAMDGVGPLIAAEPGAVLIYAATAFAASLGFQALSYLAFCWMTPLAAATIGLAGGNRNMAVVWANLGSAATPELMLFFAAMQLPIYALPILLAPVYRRLAGRGAALTAASPEGRRPGKHGMGERP